jgi:hypothetical protein
VRRTMGGAVEIAHRSQLCVSPPNLLTFQRRRGKRDRSDIGKVGPLFVLLSCQYRTCPASLSPIIARTSCNLRTCSLAKPAPGAAAIGACRWHRRTRFCRRVPGGPETRRYGTSARPKHSRGQPVAAGRTYCHSRSRDERRDVLQVNDLLAVNCVNEMSIFEAVLRGSKRAQNTAIYWLLFQKRSLGGQAVVRAVTAPIACVFRSPDFPVGSSIEEQHLPRDVCWTARVLTTARCSSRPWRWRTLLCRPTRHPRPSSGRLTP